MRCGGGRGVKVVEEGVKERDMCRGRGERYKRERERGGGG